MRIPIITMAAIACSAAYAQERTRASELSLPIPISSPRALEPGTPAAPLTPEEKINRAIRNTISPRALVNRLIISSYNHVMDDPEEWSGNLDGLAHRYAARMGRLAVRQGVQLGTNLAFRIDPRYDRCNCAGFKARFGHAWKRVIVSRTDYGSQIPAISNFAGAYLPPVISSAWHPPSKSSVGYTLSSGSQFLALRGATNVLREFWPEISRSLRLRRFKAGD